MWMRSKTFAPARRPPFASNADGCAGMQTRRPVCHRSQDRPEHRFRDPRYVYEAQAVIGNGLLRQLTLVPVTYIIW